MVTEKELDEMFYPCTSFIKLIYGDNLEAYIKYNKHNKYNIKLYSKKLIYGDKL